MPYILILILSLGTKSLVEVDVSRSDLPELIACGFELDGYKDGVARGLVDYERIIDLEAYGLDVRVIYEDYRDANRWVYEQPNFGYYHSYTEMHAAIESLARDYSTIARMETIGYSVQNRAIFALKVSDNPDIEEAEPTFIFDGDIHGNEIIAGEVVLAQAKKLCYDYGSDTLITRLVDECESWLIPMDNPDGVVAGTRYNANGVDLNRDFGYQWGATGGSPGPFSQPETKVRRDIYWKNYSLNTVHFHSGTELYIYPWGFTTMATPDSARMEYIAQRYTNYFPVSYGQIARVLYSVYGGSTDYFYGCFGDLAPAVELSYWYAPPQSQIDHICEQNVGGMVELMRISQFGIRGIVTDSITGQPLPARIEVNNTGWQVYADPLVGDYYRFLLSGTYTVTAHANGYYDKTVSGVAVPSNGWTVVNFELVPEDGQHYGAYAVPSCRTRRNPSPSSDIYFTLKCLGTRDNQSLRLNSNGWIVLDMGPTSPIINNTGNDLTVVTTTTGQTYRVYVADTLDGNFVQIGQATQTASFDIDPSGLSEARYVRVNASGSPAIDAVESDMPVGVAEPEVARRIDLKVLQNPSDRIRFQIGGPGIYKVRIYDCQGRVVDHQNLNLKAGKSSVVSRRLPAGVYFLNIEGNNHSRTEKCLVISR
ncbi:MAG TPA: T9SS type A sorting domain-containing protein [bacterium (Candidatus Stahlbacteria)]|nr:T9SS type A sorting domain-containing protein [Candidatus Stahlbacteria bacterium]